MTTTANADGENPLLHLAPTATEVFLEFRDFAEWSAWEQENASAFTSVRDGIVQSISAYGFIEPITGDRRPSACTKVDLLHLRESISAAELNSRKRAGLYVLERYTKLHAPFSYTRLKILGAEAVTRAASILRGRFPYYQGCEYLPDEEERTHFFPIPHVDLQAIALPGASFDVFYSCDVFEHLSDVDQALSEILRILKPGGCLVSVFPFLPNRESSIMLARLDPNGQVEHLEPPQYHGNPVKPSDGSLVFSLPAWDILDRCRSLGYQDPKMILVASARCGITSNGPPGVFVLTAGKPPPEDASIPVATQSQLVFDARGVTRVLGIVGLPHSATTPVASILSAHPRALSIPDPWLSGERKVNFPSHWSLMDLLDELDVAPGLKDVLVLKTASADTPDTERLHALMRSTPYPLSRDLVIILASPFELFCRQAGCHLATAHDARPDEVVRVFDAWADHFFASLKLLAPMARHFNGLLVSYERLVSDPSYLGGLMMTVGLPVEVGQSASRAYLDEATVRSNRSMPSASRDGDPPARSKSGVDDELMRLVSGACSFGRVQRVEQAIRELQHTPLARVSPLRFPFEVLLHAA